MKDNEEAVRDSCIVAIDIYEYWKEFYSKNEKKEKIE
jgi:hypothetical protein